MNSPGKSSAPVLGFVKRLTKIVKEIEHSWIPAATGTPSLAASLDEVL